MSPAHNHFFLAVVLAAGLLLGGQAHADVLELRPDHPDKYVVVKGDTLWDIASRFLKSPWLWPRIWKINEQIANPHLIYPGDVILFRWVDGQPQLSLLRGDKLSVEPGQPAPTVSEGVGVTTGPGRGEKLEPQIRTEPLRQAIPTIPPDAIGPFLTRPLVMSRSELKRAGYVAIGLDDRLAMGDNSEFYARGMRTQEVDQYYYVVRQGKALRDPESGRFLGYEAVHLGDARLLVPGDPAKLVVTTVAQEILPGDRLLPSPRTPPLPYYYPHAPEKKVRGAIISAYNAVAEMGPFTVVAISLGERDGMERGHVLRIMRHAGKRRDPVTHLLFNLPDEESGLLMIFRTFDRVSYGLVMSATQPIHVGDRAITP